MRTNGRIRAGVDIPEMAVATEKDRFAVKSFRLSVATHNSRNQPRARAKRTMSRIERFGTSFRLATTTITHADGATPYGRRLG